ncbi:sulfite exporter TauE/SafE family protein [Marinobacterium sp. AK62]|uniref:Probable membrane transporter protein n=1 Tax=Marinobacterium alkalitolerans TaxID=1542925 RepID=A0ABS3ZB35_9GAMM|nr:sulfite exporter TauE/SafE family protein [Marinobacterium alkalitolerans]MBP0048254.1 sulfite exporter TauE/SafE family protein [Marinobacterium alkalitolerans]
MSPFVSDALAIAIVTTGVLIQSRIGIGYGLLAAPLLFSIDPAYVPGPILAVGFCLALLTVTAAQQTLSWSRVFPAILARIPGAWLGASLIMLMSPATLGLLLGGMLLVGALISWRTPAVKTSTAHLALGGFTSGVLGTATSIGGPPIALVYQSQPPATARSELAAFFLAGTLISLVMLGLNGQLAMAHIWLTIKLLPGVLLGYYLALLSEQTWVIRSLKPWVLLISVLAALMPITEGVLALSADRTATAATGP